MDESIDERILWDNLESIEKQIEEKKYWRKNALEVFDSEIDNFIKERNDVYKKLLKIKICQK